MALLTPFDLSSAKRVGRAYGLEIAEVEPLALGSVNSNFRLRTASGQVLFGRIYEEQGQVGASWEARLLRALSDNGVATAAPLPRVVGSDDPELGVEAGPLLHAGKPVAFYPWIAGESLCSARVQPHHCASLGRALARVHLTSPSLGPIPEGRFGLPELAARLAMVRQQSPKHSAQVDEIAAQLQRYAKLRDPQVPGGVIHGDLFRDNVLWRGDDLCALLDFESACRGAFIYDIMVCILAWCFTDRFELERVASLVQGYESERPLSPVERSNAKVEGAIACLRFATTRLTDFELRTKAGERPGRDYRRFLARLAALEAGALSSVLAV
jgi:homoserine kinase type II